MSTTIVAYTEQAPSAGPYQIDITSVATNTLVATLDAPPSPEAYAVNRLGVNGDSPTFNPTSIRVEAGAAGCVGPVQVFVFRDEGTSFNQTAAVIASFVYPGSGSMTVPLNRAAAVQSNRGFDYYLTVALRVDNNNLGIPFSSPDSGATLRRIEGMPRQNFIGTAGAAAFLIPGRGTAGDILTDEFGLTADWPDPNFYGGRREITFGVNVADIPSLGSLVVRFSLPPATPAPAVMALVAAGYRGAAFIAGYNTGAAPVYDAGTDTYTLTLNIDWARVQEVFPLGAAPVPRRNNQLIKGTGVTEIAQSYGIPADPGRPALPARTVNFSREVCYPRPDFDSLRRQGWTYTPPRAGESYTTPLAGWSPPGLQPINPFTAPGQFSVIGPTNEIGLSGQIPYITVCSTVVTQVLVPAQTFRAPTPGVPPTPAQALVDYRIGWTGRARSIASIQAAGEMSFRAPRSNTGAVVGLNREFRSSGYSDIRFAFRLENGVASTITPEGVTALGAYAEGAEFKLRRYKGRMVFFIDDVVVLDVPNSSEPLHMDAIMYTGNDSIYDPVLYGITSSEVELRALSSAGGGMQYTPPTPPAPVTAAASLQYLTGLGWATRRPGAFSAGLLSPLETSSRPAVRVEVALSALQGLASDRPYGEGRAALLPFITDGEGGLASPSYAVANGIFSLFSANGGVASGEIMGGDHVLQPLIGMASDRPYAAGTGELLPLRGIGRVMFPLEAQEVSVLDFMIAGSSVAAFTELSAVVNSTGHVTGLMSLSALVNADATSVGQATTEFALQALLSANAVTSVTANSVQSFGAEGGSVWVVNAESGGSSRYEQYEFNSFAKIDGKYYGARADGIYLLEGDTDAGAPINASINFGRKNFGGTATQLMRLENCYLGMSSTGRMVLRVTADGKTFDYVARRASADMATQRVDIGRGLRANFFEFELYNQNGDDFDLNSIEFAAVVLSRRI